MVKITKEDLKLINSIMVQLELERNENHPIFSQRIDDYEERYNHNNIMETENPLLLFLIVGSYTSSYNDDETRRLGIKLRELLVFKYEYTYRSERKDSESYDYVRILTVPKPWREE